MQCNTLNKLHTGSPSAESCIPSGAVTNVLLSAASFAGWLVLRSCHLITIITIIVIITIITAITMSQFPPHTDGTAVNNLTREEVTAVGCRVASSSVDYDV